MRPILLTFALLMLAFSLPARAGILCQPSAATYPDPVFGLSVTGPYDAPFWQSVDELQVKWLRAEVRWDQMEKKKGVYDFAVFDDLMLEASNRGVKLLVVFDHPPAWASKKRAVFLSRLEAVSAAMAMRSGSRVSAWEVFNEPNLPGHGWPFKLPVKENAGLYAAAVQAMGTGIRSRGHHGLLIVGALSPQGQPADEFLNAFINATPCACYDIVSVHPYGKIGQLAATQKDFEKRVQAMAGLPIKVWFTEVGYDGSTGREKVLSQALNEAKNVHALFWFTLRDSGDNGHYGLTSADNLRKPEFDRVKDWLNKK